MQQLNKTLWDIPKVNEYGLAECKDDRCSARKVPALEIGDDLPDVIISSSISRGTIGGSRRPIAFVLTDPTAAGAL